MKIPKPCSTPEFAFLSSPEGELWLSYELARDFLSAPRNFALLYLCLGEEGGCYFASPAEDVNEINSVDELVSQQGGFYYLSLANCRQQINIKAVELVFLEQRYHLGGAKAVLVSYLGDL